MTTTPPRILSLCSGYGGIELAVRAALGGHVVAGAELDPYAAQVFAHHHPGIPNLGDITTVDWHAVRDEHAPDVVAAGFPCTDISNAGLRKGIHGSRSGIWRNVAAAIRVTRPRIVFLENVSAIRSRGLDTVAADLAEIGYDARWTCVRAGDPEVGAPHPRDRWFAIAHPADAHPDDFGRHWRTRDVAEAQGRPEPANAGHPAAGPGGVTLMSTPVVADARGTRNATANRRPGAKFNSGKTLTDVAWLLPTPAARDWKSGASNLLGRNSRPLNEVATNLLGHIQSPDAEWVTEDGTDYGPAIRRWEQVLGRPAPLPTELGPRGGKRLTSPFVEWMMGLPAGHVTGLGLPRAQELKILGNGVVPQQARHAYGLLLGMRLPAPEPRQLDLFAATAA